jgi:hypothetical protein
MGLDSPEAVKWAGDDGSGEEEKFQLYPENATAAAVFLSMSTQWDWTGGMESRRCGLKHEVLPLHMRKIGVPKKRRLAVMDDVQVMEQAALAVWCEA